MRKLVSIFLALLLIMSSFSLAGVSAAPYADDKESLVVQTAYAIGRIRLDEKKQCFYVLDWGNGELYRYKMNGNLDTAWGDGGKAIHTTAFQKCIGLFLLDNGDILMSSWGNNKILLFDGVTGEEKKSMDFKSGHGVFADKSGNIYLVAANAQSETPGVHVLNSEWEEIRYIPYDRSLLQVCMDEESNLYGMVYGGSYVKMDVEGTPDTAFTPPEVTFSEADVQYANDKVYSVMQNTGMQRMSADGTEWNTLDEVFTLSAIAFSFSKHYIVASDWQGTNACSFEILPISPIADALPDVTDVPALAPKTAQGLKLPQNVELTFGEQTGTAPIVWDVSGAAYDPASGDAQSFTVKGTYEIPEDMQTEAYAFLGYSNTVEVSVNVKVAEAAPVFTVQPVPQTVTVGEKATFSVTADFAESYQWQMSKDGGESWSDIEAATDTQYSPDVTLEMNQTQFRCVATNKTVKSVSDAVVLTVKAPVIPEPPVDDSPKTGDTAAVAWFVLATMLSAGSMMLLMFKKKAHGK